MVCLLEKTLLHTRFDGDEGNIHVPQGPRCQAEMETQMNIETKIMTDQTSTNVINLVQGVVYCIYLLTRDDYQVPWNLFCDYAFIVECWDWQDVLQRSKKHFSFHCEKDENDNVIYTKNTPIEKPQKEWLIPGKVVFSLMLPRGYSRTLGKDGVKIENGILVSGQLTKKTMNRIIEDLYIEFSHQHAIDYINHANFLANKLNTIRGYTFSLRDCLNTQQDKIDACLNDTFKEVDYIDTIPVSQSEKDVMVREVLDKATQIGQVISKDGMVGGELNAMAIATRSEAKGSMVNLSYISCFLGLQTVLGDHYKPEICEGTRVSPCFKFGDKSIKSKGFIMSNFYKGLDPIELFFHAWSSRKGLIDTAVTTKTSGYTHRQFGKKMENSHIDKSYVIRNCDNSIIDFCYGEFGFDAAEVYWTGGIAFFTDIKQMVLRINLEFEEMVGIVCKNIPKFSFDNNTIEYISRQLLIPGTTEPVYAMKQRIMYIIKKELINVPMYVDKWCITEFMSRIRVQFNRSRVVPGNMVGFKATCAIGSVSTQDALNAFHASGTSSKATTTGLPRLEELTNLTANPKVTGGSFSFDDPVLNLTGKENGKTPTDDDMIELKKLKMKRVEELRKIFEYKSFGDFCDWEILKTSDGCVTNEYEEILDIHPTFEEPVWFATWFSVMEIDPIDYDNGFIIRCTIKKDVLYRYKMSLHDLCAKLNLNDMIAIPSPPSVGEIYIFPLYDGVVVPKGIDTEQDSWKYYWTRDVFVSLVLDTYVCGIYNIQKIFYSARNVVDYQGHNFKELMKVPGVVFKTLHTDVIWEVVEYLGIHAAYHFLYEELTKCLSKQLNPSHVMLLARTMTNEGFLTNVTRNGINRKVGVLTKASFETPVDNFVTAAVWGENDGSNSLASSYFLGVPGKYGTRFDSFDLLGYNGKVVDV
uniref:DNA-directed RNA polymerase n=1 Tax=viral metagenome TaxID=1070528 RepID=A0A6C0JRK4_9ZZZZ